MGVSSERPLPPPQWLSPLPPIMRSGFPYQTIVPPSSRFPPFPPGDRLLPLGAFFLRSFGRLFFELRPKRTNFLFALFPDGHPSLSACGCPSSSSGEIALQLKACRPAYGPFPGNYRYPERSFFYGGQVVFFFPYMTFFSRNQRTPLFSFMH